MFALIDVVKAFNAGGPIVFTSAMLFL